MTIAPRADLVLMSGYHSPQLDVSVRLNTNESPLPPPEEWEAELARAVAEVEWRRYPDRGAGELRAALASLHQVDEGQVFVANGSNEVLQCLLLAYGGHNRSAVVFEPTYALHSHLARVTGTTVVEGERDEELALDLGRAVDLVEDAGPAVTFLCSPNNPTGMVEPPEVLEVLLSAAPGLVVVDEAYGQFAPRSALEELRDGGPENLVVVRTYSKTWAMAGARLGYCIGSPEVVENLWKVVLPYHLDSFKQVAGRLALDHVAEMEGRVAMIVEERLRLVSRLDALPVRVWPSGANFVLFRPRDRKGGDVWKELVDRDVLVRNCSTWPRLEGCLRVTIGRPEENDLFLRALTEILTPVRGSSPDPT